MKKTFSPKWKASKQKRKQRKYRAKAPLHVKRKMLASHLSKELQKKYNKRAFVIRKDDTVKIMRGTFKKRQGKIMTVNTMKGIVYIEGVQRTRKDGTKVNVPFRPSNLLILTLTEDRRRFAKLERRMEKKESKGKIKEKTEKTTKENAS